MTIVGLTLGGGAAVLAGGTSALVCGVYQGAAHAVAAAPAASVEIRAPLTDAVNVEDDQMQRRLQLF